MLDLYTDSEGSPLESFTRVANNLPGVLQYLDLVRDAAHAFDLPDLPANEVDDSCPVTGRKFAAEDDVLNWGYRLSWPFDLEELKKKRKANKEKRDKAKRKEKKNEGKHARVEEEDEESGDESADEEEEEFMAPAEWATNSLFAPDAAYDEEDAMRVAVAASLETLEEEEEDRNARQHEDLREPQDSQNLAGGLVEPWDGDGDEAQMQMAIAASLEDGLLGAGERAEAGGEDTLGREERASEGRASPKLILDDDVF